jgi:hypothetical protein
MFFDILSRAFLALGFGIIVGIAAWYLISEKRRALRIIDLASYAMTLIALGSGLFSVRHLEERWNASLDRLHVYNAISDNGFDDVVRLYEVCPDIPHSPFQPTKKKRDECHQLLEYLRNHQYGGPGHWNTLPPPDVPSFTVPELRDFTKEITVHVVTINKAILAYNAKTGASGVDPYEALFLIMAIPMLAFAFGLGISRRAIDLYSDWRS